MVDTFIFSNLTLFLIAGTILIALFFLIPTSLLKIKIPTIIIGLALLIVGLFYSGRDTEIQKNELIQAKLESEIAELKLKSSEKTNEVVTKYIDRIKVIEKEKLVYVSKTNEILNDQIINAYPVPNGVIRLLDDTVQGRIPEPPRSSDEEPSAIKINTVTESVIDNYLTCKANAEQLIALQNWIKEQQKLFNSK
jgi:hypothetical protein